MLRFLLLLLFLLNTTILCCRRERGDAACFVDYLSTISPAQAAEHSNAHSCSLMCLPTALHAISLLLVHTVILTPLTAAAFH